MWFPKTDAKTGDRSGDAMADTSFDAVTVSAQGSLPPIADLRPFLRKLIKINVLVFIFFNYSPNSYYFIDLDRFFGGVIREVVLRRSTDLSGKSRPRSVRSARGEIFP